MNIRTLMGGVGRQMLFAFLVVGASLVFNHGKQASAAIITDFTITGLNQIQDTDYERLVKGAGNNDPLLANTLQVGDSLEAMVVFDAVNNSTSLDMFLAVLGDYGLLGYQITAYSKITIESITATAIPGLYDYTFSNGIDANTAVQLYEQAPIVPGGTLFDSTVSAAAGIAAATDGTLLLTLGINDTDDFWEAFGAPLDIGVFDPNDPDPTLQGGDFFFGLSIVSNPGLLPITPDAMPSIAGGNHAAFTFHDVTGNGSLKAPPTETNSDWDAQTDTLFFFVNGAIVPEPASMLIWSGVLCAAGVGALRRNRKTC